MIYAEYEYYKDNYYGTMAEEDFKRLSRQASVYLDHVCFDRIADVTDEAILAKVKDACCAVADAYLMNENGVVSQETNDGISVTYTRGGSNRTVFSGFASACLILYKSFKITPSPFFGSVTVLLFAGGSEKPITNTAARVNTKVLPLFGLPYHTTSHTPT